MYKMLFVIKGNGSFRTARPASPSRLFSNRTKSGSLARTKRRGPVQQFFAKFLAGVDSGSQRRQIKNSLLPGAVAWHKRMVTN
jgi:hypothetical protein